MCHLTKCTIDSFRRRFWNKGVWEIYTHSYTSTCKTTPWTFAGGGSLFLIGRFACWLWGKADSTNCELIIMWLACYQQGRREGERSEINAARSLRNPVGNGPQINRATARFELPPRALLSRARVPSNDHGQRLYQYSIPANNGSPTICYERHNLSVAGYYAMRPW
jgi:hypothetical protein